MQKAPCKNAQHAPFLFSGATSHPSIPTLFDGSCCQPFSSELKLLCRRCMLSCPEALSKPRPIFVEEQGHTNVSVPPRSPPDGNSILEPSALWTGRCRHNTPYLLTAALCLRRQPRQESSPPLCPGPLPSSYREVGTRFNLRPSCAVWDLGDFIEVLNIKLLEVCA